MKHTKTPWVYPLGSTTVRAKSGGFHLCNMSNGVSVKEQEANAEFIVRACNSHDELVKAVKAVKFAHSHIEPANMPEWLDIIEEAIDHAEGGSNGY